MPQKLTRGDIMPEEGSFDDFSGHIVGATFDLSGAEYREKSGGVDTIMLTCEVESEGFDQPVRIGGFSCGSSKFWNIADSGKEIVSADGAGKVFRKNTKAGMFVMELYKLAGEGDVGKGADVFAARGFKPTQAEFYLGLDSRWLRKDVPNPVQKGETTQLQAPTDYLNFTEVAASAARTEVAEELVDKVIDLFLACDSDEAKTKRALLNKQENPWVTDALRSAVINKGLLAKLREEGRLG